MDFALFMERYGYKLLLAVIVVVVFAVVLLPVLAPLIAVYVLGGWKNALEAALLLGGVIVLIAFVRSKSIHLLIRTGGKISYLNRAKIFEKREEIESEKFEENYEKGNY